MFQAEAIINLRNLCKNYKFIKNTVYNSKIMAVVKADAYGHGLISIAKTLCNEGVYGFSVALISEAKELIAHGISNPILHLGQFDVSEIDAYQTGQIRCTINSIDDAKRLIEFSKESSSEINAHLKIDTGMGRMGLPYEYAEKLIYYLSDHNEINIEGLYSHFSSADKDNEYTDIQLKRFIKIKEIAEKRLPEIKYFHISNSSAIINDNKATFNMVRPGLSLYGISPIYESNPKIIPIMELKAPVVLIKNMKKGHHIGYHRTYQLEKESSVALIQAGYADGIPTSFANNGSVLYRGNKYPIIGKISMDLTCVLNHNKKLKTGNKVTFWSSDYRLEDIAKNNKKNPYEILTNISKRVARVYKKA